MSIEDTIDEKLFYLKLNDVDERIIENLKEFYTSNYLVSEKYGNLVFLEDFKFPFYSIDLYGNMTNIALYDIQDSITLIEYNSPLSINLKFGPILENSYSMKENTSFEDILLAMKDDITQNKLFMGLFYFSTDTKCSSIFNFNRLYFNDKQQALDCLIKMYEENIEKVKQLK